MSHSRKDQPAFHEPDFEWDKRGPASCIFNKTLLLKTLLQRETGNLVLGCHAASQGQHCPEVEVAQDLRILSLQEAPNAEPECQRIPQGPQFKRHQVIFQSGSFEGATCLVLREFPAGRKHAGRLGCSRCLGIVSLL